MLRSLKQIIGFTIQARNGEIGSLDDLYFDDEKWTIRYLVINTGSWLMGRRVLISPVSAGTPKGSTKRIPVRLTREQVEASPDVDTEKPISRQNEEELHQYYGWTPYWNFGTYYGVPGFGTGTIFPGVSYPFQEEEQKTTVIEQQQNPTLRSLNEVLGYRVEAGHGRIGHVTDMIFDDEDWSIRYLVVDTRRWFSGKKVLIAPIWVNRISWSQGLFFFDVDRSTIEDSPEYDTEKPITPEDEAKLRDYYCKV